MSTAENWHRVTAYIRRGDPLYKRFKQRALDKGKKDSELLLEYIRQGLEKEETR